MLFKVVVWAVLVIAVKLADLEAGRRQFDWKPFYVHLSIKLVMGKA